MANISGNPIDADLIPSNIKNGVNIFGVLGNYTGDLDLWGVRSIAIGNPSSTNQIWWGTFLWDVFTPWALYEDINYLYLFTLVSHWWVWTTVKCVSSVTVIDKNTNTVTHRSEAATGSASWTWAQPAPVFIINGNTVYCYSWRRSGGSGYFGGIFDISTLTWTTTSNIWLPAWLTLWNSTIYLGQTISSWVVSRSLNIGGQEWITFVPVLNY